MAYHTLVYHGLVAFMMFALERPGTASAEPFSVDFSKKALRHKGFISAEPYLVEFALGKLQHGGNGSFRIKVHPEWAPRSAERFAKLLDDRFFDNAPLYHVIQGVEVVFGIAGHPASNAQWLGQAIPAEEVKVSNSALRLSFLANRENSRTTQILMNLEAQPFYDERGVAPFAEIVDGLWHINIINHYRVEPELKRIREEGNTYLEQDFPKISYIRSAYRVDQSPVSEPVQPGMALAPPWLAAAVAFTMVAATGGGFALWSKRVLPDKAVFADSAS